MASKNCVLFNYKSNKDKNHEEKINLSRFIIGGDWWRSCVFYPILPRTGKDPKVLIKLGELEKDKSKAKKYFGDACDLRSQEGCDKYRELNQKEDINK